MSGWHGNIAVSCVIPTGYEVSFLKKRPMRATGAIWGFGMILAYGFVWPVFMPTTLFANYTFGWLEIMGYSQGIRKRAEWFVGSITLYRKVLCPGLGDFPLESFAS